MMTLQETYEVLQNAVTLNLNNDGINKMLNQEATTHNIHKLSELVAKHLKETK